MNKVLLTFLLLVQNSIAWALGSPQSGSASDSLFESTGSINQVTTTTDSPGDQTDQWDQEEENLELTDKEKEDVIQQEERDLQEESIEDDMFLDGHRYDEPSGETYSE